MDNPPQPMAAGGTTHRFLTFRVGADIYALPAQDVAEVIRLPPLARLPQAPAALMGIASLRGATLPVASLRALLGRAAPAARPTPARSAAARAIVLRGAAAVALAVDAVDDLVTIGAAQIEPAEASAAVRPGERLTSVFRFHDDRDLARVLDMPPLLAAAFVPRPRPPRPAVAPGPAQPRLHPSQAASPGGVGERLVTFEAAGQEYGLPIGAVQEIRPLPPSVTALPPDEAVARGVAVHRGRLLPLFALRGLLGLPAQTEGGKGAGKVVVVRVSGHAVGLVVDRMRDVLPADPASVEPVPPVLAARIGGELRIPRLLRAENGRRLVPILDPQTLFREEVMQRLDRREAGDAVPDAAAAAGEMALLVFRLGEDEYALPIGAVDEVVKAAGAVTRIPGTPKFLEGVVNLRGSVLPIIDQRRRFDMPALPPGAPRRIIVVRTDRHRAGIVVDRVTEILRCREDAVDPAPDLAGEPARLVSGILNLEPAGRLILLLDPAELMTRAERGLLDGFAKKRREAR